LEANTRRKLSQFSLEYGLVVLVLNLVLDLFYAWLNPRIRYT
jgi:ABC-type dipeptide/oligopeptide/nickel transport system permease component